MLIWLGQIRSDASLLGWGVVCLVATCCSAPVRLRRAWHRGRRLRAAAAGSGPGGAAE